MKIILLFLGGLALCQGATYDYSQLIQYSLLFYEAQRSGKLPADQKVTWRKDSALNDKGQNGEDLTGGYYDAGDYVKFGYPMAFTATLLAWSLIDYEQGYAKANSVEDARKAVKWATDYFLKAHVSEHEFYGQVGEGNLDHNSWGRPEDMTMERPAYKIDEQNPGTELAAETAAALAAASIVFKSVDPSYSNTLLTHAKQLYDFGDNFRGKYSESINDAQQFYRSNEFEDELVWGALWLYKATMDESFLTKAQQYYDDFGIAEYNPWFSWDQKCTSSQLLLAQITQEQQYIDKITAYCDHMISGQQRTPKGLVYIDTWGSLRMAANAAYLCLEAASAGLKPTEYRAFATEQIGYALGDTGKSFVVGFGVNPPSHESHRSSSCPDAPAPCDWVTYGSVDPNPHVLYGAIVGGPGPNDEYDDQRYDYVHNEVADDYNAGYQGCLAALNEL
uniref:Endoglucanase n=1 Tax=Panesthia cribrata TaxID=112953 RepID=Q9NCE2_PANCR|nr:beta-1,4-endoglucanase 2 [Panesthia cribrata]